MFHGVPAALLPWSTTGELTRCVRNAASRNTGKMHRKILEVKTNLQHEQLSISALQRALQTRWGITNDAVCIQIEHLKTAR